MLRAVTCSFLVLFLLIGFCGILKADESFVFTPLNENDQIIPGKIIVQFKEGALPQHKMRFEGISLSLGNSSVDELNDKYNATRAEQLFHGVDITSKNADMNLPGFYVIEIDPNQDEMQAVLEYGKHPDVAHAQPVFFYPFRDVPNDPMLVDQYWLDQTNDSDIDAPEAWTYAKGSETIIVGVNDSGVLWDHPDLIDNIWQNMGEDADGDGRTIEGFGFDPDDLNGIDDDGNGRVDDLIGYDFVNVGNPPICPGEDGVGYDNDPRDFSGHGTNIAGLISATTNNGVGVAGVAGGSNPKFKGVKIMCLRSGYLTNDCLNGGVDGSAGVQCFNYAVAKGVHVINVSYGPQYSEPCNPGYGTDLATRNAIINALNHDVVVTIAAGNDNVDCPDYMAIIGGVLNIAALDQNDNKAWFSNYGTWIHLSAAGVDMQTTESDQGNPDYAAWQGTSYSAPVVAGVAALIRSHNPTLLNDSINSILINTADDLGNPDLGAGRVNAMNAIMSLPTAYFTTTSEVDTFPNFTVNFTDGSPTSGITSWDWDFGDGGSSTDQNPSHEYTQAGLYDVSLTINSPIGSDTYTYPKLVYAVGDSLYVDEIAGLSVGDTATVYFNLKNNIDITEIKIPFQYGGAANLEWVGFSVHTDGTRCDYFEKASVVGIGLNRGYIHLRADNTSDRIPDPLPPGDGPICYMKFRVGSDGQSTVGAIPGWQDFFLQTPYFGFESHFIDGYVSTAPPCQGTCGDANLDLSVNVSDAVWVINYVFASGLPPLPVLSCGDANSDGDVNVSDAVWIINFVFVAGSNPPGTCAPGAPAWGGDDCCPYTP